MSPVETLASLNERSLEALTTVQDGILEAYKTAAGYLPTDKIPTAPTLPFGPADVAGFVKESFAFQAKVLEANKSFALGLLDVTPPAPATPKAAK